MKILNGLSSILVRIESVFAALLAAMVTLLILLNIFSRSLGMALYWVDEMAIYAMVWMCFMSTSVLLKRRQSVAVNLFSEYLGALGRHCLKRFSDLMVLLFAVTLFMLCCKWYDPIGLLSEGGDFQAFQAATFNFIYTENTNTLGIKKFWVWLVIPIFAASLMLHSLNNLLGDDSHTENESGEAS